MQSCVICTVSILSEDFIHLVIIFIYTQTEMCMTTYYLYRNVHEDFPRSLFIQKLAIYEVEDQSRFYDLNCDKQGSNFVADSRNMEFIAVNVTLQL